MGRKIKFDVVLRLIPSDTGRVFQYLLLLETAKWTETLEIISFLSYCPKYRISIKRKLYPRKTFFFCFSLYIHIAYLTEQELSIFPSRNQCWHMLFWQIFWIFKISGIEYVNTPKQCWRVIKDKTIKKKVFTQKSYFAKPLPGACCLCLQVNYSFQTLSKSSPPEPDLSNKPF